MHLHFIAFTNYYSDKLCEVWIHSYTRVNRLILVSQYLYLFFFFTYQSILISFYFIFSSFPATVQAYFRLDKPVSQLVPHIGRLEYDIFGEIAISDTKVLFQGNSLPPSHKFISSFFCYISVYHFYWNWKINLAHLLSTGGYLIHAPIWCI